ncbi:MAG: AraC family transcriptional regulator [Comamonadaceae bacterium]|nr:MAG: AraC family transcriptional regulator [Comamonadaceae bacterium]
MTVPASAARDLPPLAVAATPSAFVRAILQAYAQRGIDPSPVLQRAQITPAQWQSDAARITAWQMEALSDGAMRELDDEALGWFTRRLPWGSYGMLARASISSPTLGLALMRWCRHHALLTDDILLQITEEGDTACVTLTERRDLGPLREFCLVSVLRNLHGVACWFIDSRLPLQSAQFPYPAPSHADAYAVMFPGPATFQAAHAAIRFDARYLALPLTRDEAALRVMLQRALPLTVLQYRRDRLLVQRVRQALAADPSAPHSAQALAERLHLSARTLHRQLKEEGASLQALKDDVRRARAIELLQRSDRPVKQVAQAAGFMNEKSFIRAFRGWTGRAPAEFRRHSRTPA